MHVCARHAVSHGHKLLKQFQSAAADSSGWAASILTCFQHHCMRPHAELPCCPCALCPVPWQALAELNILLVSGALPCGSLHSYSCFTQQPREQLWQHYSKYAAGRAQLSPQQLELLRFMLEWVLSP